MKKQLQVKKGLRIGGLVVLMLAVVQPAFSKEQTPTPPAQFGGTSSVGGTLQKDATRKPTVLQSYFAFKSDVEKKSGLAFGFDYNALFQAATDSLGDDTAAGGALRMFGRWGLVGKASGNTGSLVYKVENRHRLGTDIAPQDLGFEVGYVGLTAITFSDIGWALTNLYWEQHYLDNRLSFVAGITDTTDYVDVYALVDPWNDFANLAFSTNPSIPVPNQGLGAAVRGSLTENLYVLGGVADANGDPTDPGDSFDSFFDVSEFFTHLEVGWIPSYKERFTDNIHLTLWHADERDAAVVPDGWGMALSFSTAVDENWEPFVRAGYADDGGALWERTVSIGFGYNLVRQSDQIGLGLSWGRPAESFGPDLDDQYTAEIYYRFHLWRILTLTPDLQILIDPAQNPEENMVAVFGVRGRISF